MKEWFCRCKCFMFKLTDCGILDTAVSCLIKVVVSKYMLVYQIQFFYVCLNNGGFVDTIGLCLIK